jgi:hypothetical protein
MEFNKSRLVIFTIVISITVFTMQFASAQVEVSEENIERLEGFSEKISNEEREKNVNMIERSVSSAVANFFSANGVNLPNIVDYFSISLNTQANDTSGTKQALTFTFNPGATPSFKNYQDLPFWMKNTNIAFTFPDIDLEQTIRGNASLQKTNVEVKLRPFPFFGTRDQRDKKYDDDYNITAYLDSEKFQADLDDQQKEFKRIETEIDSLQKLQDALSDSLETLADNGFSDDSSEYQKIEREAEDMDERLESLDSQRFEIYKKTVSDHVESINAKVEKSGLFSLSYVAKLNRKDRPIHKVNIAWSKGIKRGIYGTVDGTFSFEPDSVIYGERVKHFQVGVDLSVQPGAKMWKELQGGVKIALEGIIARILQNEAYGIELSDDDKQKLEYRIILTAPISKSSSVILRYADSDSDLVENQVNLGFSWQFLRNDSPEKTE